MKHSFEHEAYLWTLKDANKKYEKGATHTKIEQRR